MRFQVNFISMVIRANDMDIVRPHPQINSFIDCSGSGYMDVLRTPPSTVYYVIGVTFWQFL